MKLNYKIAIAIAMLGLAGFSASAADMATLQNGFAIRHERREVRGNITRLYLTGAPDNYVDVPSEEIVGYEEIVMPAPPAPEPPPAPVPVPALTLDEVVTAAGSRNNIDPDLILSVIRAESGFDPNAVSAKGAQGLMQLMPQTAALLGVQNAFDPATNVEGGTRYLGQLLARYHNNIPLALAAYNAGPERVEQYRGVPPYRETRVYVARIIRDLDRKKSVQRGPQTDLPRTGSVDQNSKAAKHTANSHPSIPGPAGNTSGAGTGS
jgi:hypothetical protein